MLIIITQFNKTSFNPSPQTSASDLDTTISNEIIQERDVVHFIPPSNIRAACSRWISGRHSHNRKMRSHRIAVQLFITTQPETAPNASHLSVTNSIGGHAANAPLPLSFPVSLRLLRVCFYFRFTWRVARETRPKQQRRRRRRRTRNGPSSSAGQRLSPCILRVASSRNPVRTLFVCLEQHSANLGFH